MLFPKKIRSSQALALEPRMMFDAAALGQLTETLPDTPDASVTDADNTSQTVVATDEAPVLEVDPTTIEYVGKVKDRDTNVYADVLASARDVAVSADGKYVYAVSTNSDSNNSNSPSVLSIFSVDESGELTLLKGYYNYDNSDKSVQNEGLAGASIVGLSEDQNYLYVFGEGDNSLVVFSRDADSGELTFVGNTDVSAFGVNGVSDFVYDIEESNGYLYVAGADSLIVLSIGDEGTLSQISNYTNGTNGVEGLTGANSIAISADGNTLVVGSSGEDSVVALFSVNENGSLDYVSSVSGDSDAYYIQSVAVSSDGKTVYALNENQGATLLVMTYDDNGVLVVTGTYDTSEEARTILLSEDGTGVFVMGASIDIFALNNATLTKVSSVEGSFNNEDFYFNSITQAYLSADNTKLFAVVNNAILTFELSIPVALYTENADATPLLPTGRISDSELDELDDYKGASYTVVRESGALLEDAFSFQDGNNLELKDGKILNDGVEIASFEVVDNALTVVFTAAANQATAQNVLRQIAYSNSSNDPVANGASPTFVITINDGDGNKTSLDVNVDLTGVNNPAVVTTTPAQLTYKTGDDYTTPLFSGTSIDTIEEGQKIAQVVLTITGASADDVIRVGTGKILMANVDSFVSTPEGVEYRVSVDGDVVRVTLYMQRSAAETAGIIDNITYKYEGDEVTGEREITLSIVEYEDYNLDGNSSREELTTTYTERAVITLAAATVNNVAPVLSGNAVTIPYTENDPAFTVFPNATLSDVQMDAYNGGSGSYHGAVLTIATGGASPNDVLSFSDGNGLSLNKGTELVKDGKVIGEVLVSDGLLTVTFTENNGVIPTTEDVTNVLNQIQYRSSSDTPPSSMIISATLTDQLGLISNALTRQIDITTVNDAPAVVIDPVLVAGDMDLIDIIDSVTGIDTVVASTVSGDGSIFYVADGDGNIVAFSQDADSGKWLQVGTLTIDGLNSVDKLIATSDGKSLYVIGSHDVPSGWGDTMMSVNTVIVITRDSINNELTETQKITGESTLNTITDLALSDDGQNVYYLHNGGLGIMKRDALTGTLTFDSSISDIEDGEEKRNIGSPSSLIVSGNYVFLTTESGYQKPSALFVFERTSSGLSLVGYIENYAVDSNGAIAKLDSPSHIAATEGGEYVYVVNGNSLASYSYDSVTKSFSVVDTNVLTFENVTDMVMSDNDKELFISTSDGTLNRYVITDKGGLILVDAPKEVTNGKTITVTEDGLVFLQGDSVAIFDAPGRETSNYEIGFEAVALAPTLAIYDAEFSAVDNYKGLTFSIQSTSPNADDVFNILSDSGFSIQGGNLFFNDALVGTFTADNGVLSVAITDDLTQNQVNTLVQNVSYENSSLTEAITQTFIVSTNDGEINGIELQAELNVVRNSIPEAIGGYVMPSIMETAPTSILLPEGLFVDAGGDPLAWSVSGLPSGLTFDPLTRTISGRTSETGNFTLTFTATDPRQQSASLELSLVVGRLPVVDHSSDENDAFISSTATRPSPFINEIGSTLAQGGLDSLLSTTLHSGSAFDSFSANDLRMTSLSRENADSDSQSDAQSPLPMETYRFTSLTWFGGDSKATISLLESVLSSEEKTILAVTLADGVSLPDGVEFDADTGELTINKAVLEATDQIELHILVVDEQGNASVVPVEVTLQAAQQASAVPFAKQVKNAGLMSLSDDSQALLAELSVN
uniref:Ig family protein n=1 Tax=Marinomonas sp. (strain MWYL1) TaxID=400668 RepID=A6VS08_MARMS